MLLSVVLDDVLPALTRPQWIAVAFVVAFVVLVVYQCIYYVGPSAATRDAPAKVTATPKKPKATPKKAQPSVSKKSTPARSSRAKTPVASARRRTAAAATPKEEGGNVVVTFTGSFGLRIEKSESGNVFVSGFVGRNPNKGIKKGMFILSLNGVPVPEIEKIDEMVDLISAAKSAGPVTVVFSPKP